MRGGDRGVLGMGYWFVAATALAWLAVGSAGCFSPSRHHPRPDAISGSQPTRSPFHLRAAVSRDSTSLPEQANGLDLEHARVKDSVRIFQASHRRFMTRALARSQLYLPTVSAILARRGVPTELAYMPIIESGYRCDAVSPTGAVGPWQFIRSTARRYGLRIGRGVDERKDPIRSTDAAARYLSDLYERFGDWNLALAAYNSGEGEIEEAIARSGATSFWELAPHLRHETRRFVPQVLAAAVIGQAPRRYGFYVPSGRTLSDAPLRFVSAPERPRNPRVLRYRVVRGDTLVGIAKRHRIPLATLRAYNRVENPRRLKPGQLLLIPIRVQSDGRSARPSGSGRPRRKKPAA